MFYMYLDPCKKAQGLPMNICAWEDAEQGWVYVDTQAFRTNLGTDPCWVFRLTDDEGTPLNPHDLASLTHTIRKRYGFEYVQEEPCIIDYTGTEVYPGEDGAPSDKLCHLCKWRVLDHPLPAKQAESLDSLDDV